MVNRTCRVAFCMATCLFLASLAMQQSGAGTSSCPPGADEFTEYRLFFGRNRDGEEVVGESDWRNFLAGEITPRFPDGLTVLDAAGQWRDESGTIIRERSKLVVILAAHGRQDALRNTDEIMESYKRAFDQESVLRTISRTCASF